MKRIVGLLPLVCCITAWAATTTTWELNTYQDFLRGRFQGVSLTRDGRLKPAPKLEPLFVSDQPIIWSIVRAGDGTIYAATGHRGRLYKIDPAGKSSLLWTAPQPEIFALALGPSGELYAGTSPDGAIYRIENGKASEYFAPKTKYIWSLAVAPGGVLYAGTGEQGKIFRIESAGKGELYYATGQSHVTSLALDPQGRLLAGSEPNGILYRVSGKDKAFVLYDANLPEIHAIAAEPDGTIYAAALGGSLSRRSQTALQALQGTLSTAATGQPITTITVTAEGTQAGPEIKPPQETSKQPPAPQTTAAAAQPAPAADVSGVEKSALYRINPDSTVETLWSSKEENIYDLLPQAAGQILFSTDGGGRIYQLGPDHKATLMVQTNESEATRLLAGSGGVLAATGESGRIYRLGHSPAPGGTYESPVHDSGTVARWGRLSWRADGSGLSFRTRTGNSQRPDRTWSEWSEPMTSPSAIRSPNARYIQWKAEFSGNPELDSVTVAYVPQNTPPVVKSITVFNQPAAQTPSKSPAPSQQQTTASYSITVTDTGDASTSSGTPAQTLTHGASQQINITWQAEDPDGDRLVYNLYFRGEGETQWKLLRANLHDNTYLIDGDSLADGKYFFRVTASDREANPPATARQAELESAPVLIDNTPPLVTLGTPRRSGGALEVAVEASDAASALRRAEYSLDATMWVPLEADDGVIDSPRETFTVRLDRLTPGEHLLVVRVVDSAGNAGLAKVVLR